MTGARLGAHLGVDLRLLHRDWTRSTRTAGSTSSGATRRPGRCRAAAAARTTSRTDLAKALREGETVVCGDTESDPGTVSEAYRAIGVRSFVMVPFRRQGDPGLHVLRRRRRRAALARRRGRAPARRRRARVPAPRARPGGGGPRPPGAPAGQRPRRHLRPGRRVPRGVLERGGGAALRLDPRRGDGTADQGPAAGIATGSYPGRRAGATCCARGRSKARSCTSTRTGTTSGPTCTRASSGRRTAGWRARWPPSATSASRSGRSRR